MKRLYRAGKRRSQVRARTVAVCLDCLEMDLDGGAASGEKYRFKPQFTVRYNDAMQSLSRPRHLKRCVLHPLQAVILTNDDDNSLYPLTNELPKSLLPVGNRPILKYQLDLLSSSGFTGEHCRMMVGKCAFYYRQYNHAYAAV